MQKIAARKSEAGQSMNTDGVTSIRRIQFRNSSEAKAYVSLVVMDAAVREYEKGNFGYVGRIKVA